MSIPLTGTGGLFTRLGHLISTLETTVNGFRGTTLVTRANLTAADYDSTDQSLASGIYTQLASAQSGLTGFVSYIKTLAQNSVTQMVNEAFPQPDSTYATALSYLATYLVANSQTVQRNTISATVTAGGSNTGNGNLLVGMTSHLGAPLEFVYAETLTGTITRDAQSGGATAGQETLSLAGQFAVSDPLSWLYPAGSGASVALAAVNAGSSNGSGTRNQLNNGNFEGTWTSNVPAGWHVGVGTPGTTILQSTSQHYAGANSLEFVGNGTENTSLETRLGTDTTAAPSPYDQLAVNLWVKVDVVPAAGVLSVELVDGSGSAILDAAGNTSVFTINLTTLTTSWVAYGGFLRTPRVLPSQVWLRLRLSTALSSGSNLFLDRIAMAEPTPLYTGGPLLAAFSGSTAWIDGDNFSVTIANNFGGALHSGCDRLLNLRTNGVIFPSAASSPTIADSLVS